MNKTNLDLKWPRVLSYKFKKSFKFSEDKILKIEDFFCRRYNSIYACITPSSRASIATILDFLRFDRSKIVSIPKWSCHSLFEVIGSRTNVSIDNFKADLLVIFNKLGVTKKFINSNILKNKYLIEDSVDSLPSDNNFKPFNNDGIIEIVSLPKIIGAYSGGIMLTRSKLVYNFYKEQQKKNQQLGWLQSKKKYNFFFNFKKNKFNSWAYDECWNTSFDNNVLNNIEQCLKYFDYNIQIILKRRKIIEKFFPESILDYNRLGPCVVFKKDKYSNLNSILEKLHFNFSQIINKYDEAYIFPIHFGIKDNLFFNLLKRIRKKYN